MTIQKAVRATFSITKDITLEGFQKPCGGYALGANSMRESLNILLTNKTGKKYAQPILDKHPGKVTTAKLEGNNASLRLIDLEVAMEIILAYAQLGNSKCQALVFACFTETIERRLDAAFGFKRTEEEYNQKLTERINGKVDRLTFTDAIALWLIDPRNDPSENTKRFIYSNCSDCLNLIVLGYKSRKAKEILGVAEDSLLRDALPVQCLREIAAVERLACILVMEDNMHPLEAVKQASVAVRARRVDF